MKIKKDQKITIRSRRKGIYKAIAVRDFDTETDDFYPVAALESVRGITQVWKKGDLVPCRRTLSTVIVDPEE